MGTKEYETSIDYKYYWKSCNNIHNFDSYLTQLKEVSALEPKNVLEIGCGNKLFSTHLRNYDVNVVTMDINQNLNPVYVKDISAPNAVGCLKECFDCVCAFEVLEHIPESRVDQALENIYNLTTKYVVISLPFRQRSINFLTSIRFFRAFGFYLPFKRAMAKAHYWEVDFNNLQDIINKFSKYFKRIEYKFPIYNRNHIFFIMEKR